jgi:FKBP-type peptidyl-prolyl cis-trans isomerase
MVRLIGTLTVLVAGAPVLTANAQSGDTASKTDPMHPHVKMVTTLGDILLELDAEKAPVTSLNFIRYAEDKFYDGTVFHRVMNDFMIQGGGFTVEMDKKPGLREGIQNEWRNGLKNVRGTIAMARLGGRPDSATAQFFINVVDNPALDQAQRDGAGYCVFGKVVEGMDTVDKIRDTEVGTHEKYGRGRSKVVPVEAVVVNSVRLVSEFDRTRVESLVKDAEEAAKAAAEAAKATEKQAEAERTKKMQVHASKLAEEAGKQVVTTDSGLMYIDLEEGDGPMPGATDKVEVHYTGWLLDGTKFDSSLDRGTPFPFSLAGGVIPGWLEGVATMKVGGKRKLIIPPELGYGKRGAGARIPPDSVLVFDVELLRIVTD